MFSARNTKKLIIGLVHLKPLPGTPYFQPGDFERSLEKAIADTESLIEGGADGCLIQSVDKVYSSSDDTDYARVAAIALITNEVRKVVGSRDFKVGVQLMWNCITPSLAVAKVCTADFTRATALIGTTPSPFGTIEADPLRVQRYRNAIQARDVAIIAEIHGYHFKGEYSSEAIRGYAQSACNAGADALEVMHRDEELNNRMVHDLKTMHDPPPVVLGGGTNLENVQRRMQAADAALVGSCFEGGAWGSRIDQEIVKQYVDLVRAIER